MLLRRLIWVALGLALVVGSVQALLTQWQAVPLILAAEVFEDAPAAPATTPAAPPLHGEPGHDHAIHHDPALFASEAPTTGHEHATAADHEHDAEAWAPADGGERTFWTWVASVLDSLALALLTLAALTGIGLLYRQRGTALPRTWALGLGVAFSGWFGLHLWPSLGLPVELPGMAAAELGARQGWWLLAVVCGLGACALAALPRSAWRWPLALALLALPFLVGAPHPDADPLAGFGPEAQATMRVLLEHFEWVTHGLALTHWLGLGLLGGWAYTRWVHPLLQAGAVTHTSTLSAEGPQA